MFLSYSCGQIFDNVKCRWFSGNVLVWAAAEGHFVCGASGEDTTFAFCSYNVNHCINRLKMGNSLFMYRKGLAWAISV